MAFPPFPSNGETNWGNKMQTWSDAVEAEAGKVSITNDHLGARVYVRDSSGSRVMVHGRTGWRDISSLLLSGFEPSGPTYPTLIRRVDDVVTLKCRLKSPESMNGNNLLGYTPLLDIPQNFRFLKPQYNPALGIAKYGVNTIVFIGNTISGNQLGFSGMADAGVWSSSTTVTFQLSWQTDQGWPGTLPGTPYE